MAVRSDSTMFHEINFDNSGEFTLSEDPSGVSKITLKNDFLAKEDADRAFQVLQSEIPWFQNSDRYGPQPRLTYWYGEHPYSYSGLTHKPNTEWHTLLRDLRDRLQFETKHTFNSVLCNLYRNNEDNVDWHCDDEPALRKNPYIASISLGAVRPFQMRKKVLSDAAIQPPITMQLAHGSLLIMEGSTQEDWQHRLPKVHHVCELRINLTFRTIYSEPRNN